MNITCRPDWIGRIAACLLLLGVASPLVAQHDALVDSHQTSKGKSDWIYYDLGCDDGAWSGYFLPSHWERRGETDRQRTSTPLPPLSDGNLLFPAGRTRSVRWSIAAPARGFLSFELSAAPELLADVRLLVNGVDQEYRLRNDRILISPFLSEGDDFSLLLPAGGALEWRQLRFHTNASGVFFYPNERISRYRFRPVSGDRIDRVLFPAGSYGQWPVFDYDGNLETSHDQQELRQDTDRFLVEYYDRTQPRPGGYVVVRTFVIRENCEGGSSLRRDVTWVPLPLLQDEPLTD